MLQRVKEKEWRLCQGFMPYGKKVSSVTGRHWGIPRKICFGIKMSSSVDEFMSEEFPNYMKLKTKAMEKR